jgi:hypothetical protein
MSIEDSWEENDIDVYEAVTDFLRNYAKLSDYIEETDLLSDQVKSILYDAEDDKIGRIRDVYHEEIKRVALWVEKNYDSDRHAKWMYDEATEYL